MENVQRSGVYDSVEPQAKGGRKGWLLLGRMKKWSPHASKEGGYISSVYRVASIDKEMVVPHCYSRIIIRNILSL